jgi:hypothetical protein
MWETSIVLGTVRSDRTVVVLLVPYLTLSVIVSTLSCIVCMLLWANQTLWHMSTIRSPFSSCLITSNLSSWIALDDVDPTFSLILVTKANTVEGGTTSPVWLYHKCNHSVHMTNGMRVMSLSGSLQHKTRATMHHVCQIVLNWKFSCIFEKWCKFSSHIKMKSHIMRPACSWNSSHYCYRQHYYALPSLETSFCQPLTRRLKC